jgi:hypothetical protein
VGEVLVDGDVAGQRAVHRWGGEELDVGAEVVTAGAALPAPSTGDARLQRDALPRRVSRRARPCAHHHAAGLVAEHERRLDHEVADAAVLVVVHVGAADAD